ncbi:MULTISPECIES: DUF2125 domain-containing protein [Methylobacterium]|uniref:DUF2125 domain-containing protein n=1 Tax=Methylobacterium thuringiense TaxID=1003091 RepID=A0ABQ4TJF5_9HYPH|nr:MULTISPECIES: DUF2125 domain-containing protein [Methylobacterium]TXN21588.1 DUF2125 domain-containing protein [Methylobacterium sp. WL9]GJE54927.1 hypothetical protein EKPJFOCH_1413 [Methylobacterium thuringiense]
MAQGPHPRTEPTQPIGKRRSRLGLFLPYILLLTLALVWSAGWYWVRGKAASEMDAWRAREAAAGRNWTCADRSITGYPFRIELRCASLKFARSDGGFSLGPLTVLVQVYQPRHAILEATGPFHVEQGDLIGDVNWTALEGSFHGASDGFVRASLVVDGPKGSISGGEPGPIDFAAKHLELHARPTPGRFESDGAVDLNLRLTDGTFPQLDPLFGNADPVEASLDATLERATVLRTRAIEKELEAWRLAEGQLDITALSLVKGNRRLQAKGEVGLDEAHRPEGQFDVRAAGLGDLIGQIMGKRFGNDRGALIGNLVGQFLGGMKRRDPEGEAGPGQGDASLQPLPTVKLAGGRLMLGPFAIPNVALPPLY